MKQNYRSLSVLTEQKAFAVYEFKWLNDIQAVFQLQIETHEKISLERETQRIKNA